ncbi:MarR family transcriptional regulator [Oleispirillum naphthae]|uniref:MarR family transcriptional regulator n=1 Tax=Oleispirillum naphthae TaxID=2838853 RepID=UPI00308251F0
MSDETRTQAELDLLAALEGGEEITQMSLSRRMMVSIGLVNALLKRAVNKGFVKVKAAPRKRYVYYVTPKGFREKARLVADYLEFSLHFFRKARTQFDELLGVLHRGGARRIVVIGGGELMEILMLSQQDSGIEVVAVLDRATNKERLQGVPVVRSFEELPDADAVIVAETRDPQEAFDRACAALGPGRVFAPPLLRIRRGDAEAEKGPESDNRKPKNQAE